MPQHIQQTDHPNSATLTCCSPTEKYHAISPLSGRSTHCSVNVHIKTATYMKCFTTFKEPITYLLHDAESFLRSYQEIPRISRNPKVHFALTSVHHLSLSWASPIQSIYPHPTSWRSVLILSTHLCPGLPSGLLPSVFPTKTIYTPLSSTIRATCQKANYQSLI